MSRALYLPNLIGLTGKAGAGKDTAARHLAHAHGYRIASFATPLRRMLGALLGYVGQRSEWMHERALKEQPVPGIGHSYRTLAQTLGTEWGRECLGQDIWLELMAGHMAVHPSERWVITDVRFANELAFVQRHDGVCWLLQRDDAAAVRGHVSEAGLGMDGVHAVLPNNGSVEELHHRIDDLLTTPIARSA